MAFDNLLGLNELCSSSFTLSPLNKFILNVATLRYSIAPSLHCRKFPSWDEHCMSGWIFLSESNFQFIDDDRTARKKNLFRVNESSIKLPNRVKRPIRKFFQLKLTFSFESEKTLFCFFFRSISLHNILFPIDAVCYVTDEEHETSGQSLSTAAQSHVSYTIAQLLFYVSRSFRRLTSINIALWVEWKWF